MYKYIIRPDDINNAAIDAMSQSLNNSNSEIGSFWYDPDTQELFGISSVPANSRTFFHSYMFDNDVRTGPKLHKDIWHKEQKRGKDPRFKGDYTKYPRGRVFEFKDIGFIVFTGNWISEFPEAKQQIVDEFEIPQDSKFVVDQHWDIGHSWTDEIE